VSTGHSPETFSNINRRQAKRAGINDVGDEILFKNRFNPNNGMHGAAAGAAVSTAATRQKLMLNCRGKAGAVGEVAAEAFDF